MEAALLVPKLQNEMVLQSALSNIYNIILILAAYSRLVLIFISDILYLGWFVWLISIW